MWRLRERLPRLQVVMNSLLVLLAFRKGGFELNEWEGRERSGKKVSTSFSSL